MILDLLALTDSSLLPYPFLLLICNSYLSGFFRFAETVSLSSFSSESETKELQKRISLLTKSNSKNSPSQSSPLNPNSTSNSRQASPSITDHINSNPDPSSNQREKEWGTSSVPTLKSQQNLSNPSPSSSSHLSSHQKSRSSSSLNLQSSSSKFRRNLSSNSSSLNGSGSSTPTFSTNPSRFKVVSSKSGKGRLGALGSNPGSRPGSRRGSVSLTNKSKEQIQKERLAQIDYMPGNSKKIPFVRTKGQATQPSKHQNQMQDVKKSLSNVSNSPFGRIIDAVAIDEREREKKRKTNSSLKSKSQSRSSATNQSQDVKMKDSEEVNAYADLLANYLKLSDLPPPSDLHEGNHTSIPNDSKSSSEGESEEEEDSDDDYVYDVYYRDFGGGVASHMPSRAAPSGLGNSEIGLRPSSIIGGDSLPAEISPSFSYSNVGELNQSNAPSPSFTGTYGHLTSYDSDEDEDDETDALDFSSSKRNPAGGLNGKINPEDGDSWDEGEDEDSNDEDFYRNDYPEQEIEDDDELEFDDDDDDDDNEEEDEDEDGGGGFRMRKRETTGGDNYDLDDSMAEPDYGNYRDGYDGEFSIPCSKVISLRSFSLIFQISSFISCSLQDNFSDDSY